MMRWLSAVYFWAQIIRLIYKQRHIHFLILLRFRFYPILDENIQKLNVAEKKVLVNQKRPKLSSSRFCLVKYDEECK